MPEMDRHTPSDQLLDVWSRPSWPKSLEKVLVNEFLEEMKNEGFISNSWDLIPYDFSDESWDRVCNEFNARTGKAYDKTELKKQLVLLHKRYTIVKPLYDQDGYGWDHRRKMIVVDDTMWKEIIRVTPEIAPYRKFGCPLYENLTDIFKDAMSPDAYESDGESSDADRSIKDNVLPSTRNMNISSNRNKRQFAEPLSSGPTKRSKNKGCSGTASGATKTATTHNNDECSSIASCITIINGMEGVDRHLYNAALDLLQNESWQKTFMSLKAEKRLTWLKAMLPGCKS